jgi:hypothetical protein
MQEQLFKRIDHMTSAGKRQGLSVFQQCCYGITSSVIGLCFAGYVVLSSSREVGAFIIRMKKL